VSAPSRDLARASALSFREWRLLIEAFAWLALLRLVTWALPYRRVASLLRLAQSDAAQALVDAAQAQAEPPAAGGGRARGHGAGGYGAKGGGGGALVGAGGPDAEAIAWALCAAARRTPWPSTCLVRSLAGCVMLRRHGVPSVVYLGVAKDAGGSLVAHSWLRCGDRVVTGGGSHQRYAAIAAYQSAMRTRG
jgi:hypothetical protein